MFNVLRKGDQGSNVKGLRNPLVQRGYPVGIDGVFGTRTYQAVRVFQSQNIDQPFVVCACR